MHHALTPIGLALCAVAYLGIAATVQSGAGDVWLMWAALVVDGAGMGFAVSPLLTQALVRVPLSQAADASGLLTTAVQLGQVIGVAVFGTVFLSLKQQSPLIVSEQSHMSAAATSTTTYSLAVLAVIGLVAALALSRTVRSASETTARAGER
jgi:hypothetical protein